MRDRKPIGLRSLVACTVTAMPGSGSGTWRDLGWLHLSLPGWSGWAPNASPCSARCAGIHRRASVRSSPTCRGSVAARCDGVVGEGARPAPRHPLRTNSSVTHPDGGEGELKLYGSACEAGDDLHRAAARRSRRTYA
jgi:hypothetical protein